ncbi:MAG: large subunit ribosomal protein L9 [Flavobacteriales bacterium]|jgi:large subunit ribosomal protein L9
MDIILKRDVENLGFKDDLVTVKPGFARNFLIPAGSAEIATPSARKVLAENLKQRARKEESEVKAANTAAEALRTAEVKITAKVGGGNKLFGSINNADIAAAIAKVGHTVDRKFIKIQGNTIKALGKYDIAVRLHRTVVINLPVEIVADKA